MNEEVKREYIEYINSILNVLDLEWVKCVHAFALRFTREEKEAAQ